MIGTPQIVLAIDTAQRGCGVAVMHRDEGVLYEHFEDMQRGQAERLMPMIEDALKAAQVDYSDIDLLAVTVGPGSFTGIRVGLSAAKALALALDTPLVGIGTFDVFARQFEMQDPANNKTVCICLETKRSDFYVYGRGIADEGACLNVDELASALEKGTGIITGDAAQRAAEHVSNGWQVDGANIMIKPSVVATLALEVAADKRGEAVEPVYLRGADVSQSKKKNAVIVNK